ncbi:hypothetical protein AMATHDRAFT_11541 [Amanita thiersii Skay4041]|uniref:Uncharacterized protein n=1 Tax=Amanita thiersii Skay4041 TaxID=703135 RepID=A0A2A9NAB1_9AGAR|nr:hypothetical protein AMATHDRAFT_11541 [Amanita thiersii Skay4041]
MSSIILVLDYLDDDYGYWLALVPHLKANDEYGKDYEIETAQINVRIAALKVLKYQTVDS